MVGKGVALALQHVWTTLRGLNLPMALIGGIALAAWNRTRFTQDVNLLIGVGNDEIDKIVQCLRAADVRPVRDPPFTMIGEVGLIQCLYEPPEQFMEFRIDLLTASTDFHRAALGRRAQTRLPDCDLEIDIVACEDLIVLKLLAGRVIDRADAAALLRANRKELQLEHLTTWCDKLALQVELDEVWDEAFPGESPPSN